MRVIAITRPEFFQGEAQQIESLLRYGFERHYRVDLVHIRKPNASREAVRDLIWHIPSDLHSRLVLHDHHDLATEYHLFGIHLNSRNPQPPKGYSGNISRSCHSLKEVQECKDRYGYVSLSPIFDSISKVGYTSAFSREQLLDAVKDGIIDSHVYALGGVTWDRLKALSEIGFGGAMLLGAAWR